MAVAKKPAKAPAKVPKKVYAYSGVTSDHLGFARFDSIEGIAKDSYITDGTYANVSIDVWELVGTYNVVSNGYTLKKVD